MCSSDLGQLHGGVTSVKDENVKHFTTDKDPHGDALIATDAPHMRHH